MREFSEWLNTFRSSIVDYSYYVDFEKVYRSVEGIKVELNILNSLIASKSIESDFRKILKDYPAVIKTIPILLAKRDMEIPVVDGGRCWRFNFAELNYTIDDYCEFMHKSGLFDLLANRLINNLVDYVTGVEVGLDSNGRKNRGGHLMENLVERYIVEAGFVPNETYFKEMRLSEIEQKWGVDLSVISNNGKAEKRFDFVIKTANKIYGIETNFYTGGGSKLNETARSYKTIALETASLSDFCFIWITDGKDGWSKARGNLQETFDVLEHLYNINDLEKGILSTVCE